MRKLEHYNLLAEVFKYPSANTPKKIMECQEFLDANFPESGEEFKRFSDFIASSTDDEIEEIFTKTFHIQATCFLDLGYVIFAEDYKRGEFLMNMKNEQKKFNNDHSPELADNLPYVLTLLPLHDDEGFVNELVKMIMVPALEKMLSEFDERKTQIREKVLNKKQKVIIMKGIKNGNIYKNAISALILLFKEDFSNVQLNMAEDIVPQYTSEFVNKEAISSDCGTGCGTTIPTPNEIKQKSISANN